MAHNLSCLQCGRPAALARETTELIRMHALTPSGTLGALYIEFPGAITGMSYLCTTHAAIEQIDRTRKERNMAVPRFENLDDAARFVVTHHRLASILSIEDVGAFIHFLYAESDGDMRLPTLVMEFFRGKIQQVDREIRGEQ